LKNKTTAAIVGAGPAGMILAYLFARQRIDVVLFEMQADFNRDFRGDTVHASTLELFDKLGLIDEVLSLPHQKIEQISVTSNGKTVPLVNFSRLPSKYPYMALMPQADLLQFLYEKCLKLPSFTCLTGAPVQSLMEADGRVIGLQYQHHGRQLEMHADLVVAADGRHSHLRKLSGLSAITASAPMDVAWCRLPREPSDPTNAAGFYIERGKMLVLLGRKDNWQLGYVFAKGDFGEVKKNGIAAFRANIGDIAPDFLQHRAPHIESWDQVHLLNIQSDHLTTWHKPGLLLIGDAAHIMSPVGGVGINCAVSDAIATANVLSKPLLEKTLQDEHLALVEQQRRRATNIIQRLQSVIQQRIVKLALNEKPFALPWPARFILSMPGLRNVPAKIFALGPTPTRLEIEIPPV